MTLPKRFRDTILAAQRSGHRVFADMLRPLGLTPAWAEVLTTLQENGPLSIRELSHFLICEADHPSRLIKRIEDKGLIARTPDPNDKRAVKLALTDAGKTAADKVAGIEAGFNEWIEQRLNSDKVSITIQTLERLMKGTPEARSLENRYTDKQ